MVGGENLPPPLISIIMHVEHVIHALIFSQRVHSFYPVVAGTIHPVISPQLQHSLASFDTGTLPIAPIAYLITRDSTHR